jgi:mRNA-degrading endonuclease RelE of RelBE toxin-antitoxin system
MPYSDLARGELTVDFRIADTFTDSLAKLRGDEQSAAKTTAFDLQLNPGNPGMQFHKLDKSKDKNFWSVRVSSDKAVVFDSNTDVSPGSVSLCTMHRAKGLEFRAVVVAAC